MASREDAALDKEFNQVMQSMQKLHASSQKNRKDTHDELEGFKRRLADLERDNQQLKSQVQDLLRENAMLRKGNASKDGYPAHATNGIGTMDGSAAEATGDLFKLVNGNIAVHANPVHDVCINPKTQIMATASWEKTCVLYDLEKQQVVNTLGTTEDPANPAETSDLKTSYMGGLYCVQFACTQDKILGCTSADHKIYLWDWQEGRKKGVLSDGGGGHSDEVNGLDFHPTKHVLCSAADDNKAIIWDFEEGCSLRVLDKHEKAVYGCKFMGPGQEFQVATCCFDRKTRIFDMRDKQVVKCLGDNNDGHTDDVIGIDICGGDNNSAPYMIATGSDDGQILVWDIRKWQRAFVFDTNKYFKEAGTEVKRVRFSPTGEYIAAGTSKHAVMVYSLRGAQSSEPAAALKHGTDCVFSVNWGRWPNGKQFLVSASHDTTCSYWEMTR